MVDIIGYIGDAQIIYAIIFIIIAFIAYMRKILLVLYRLGKGLAKRKIAVFAESNNLTSLKSLLIDSKLFNEKNIFGITRKEDFERARQATIYLVYWHDFQNDIDEILNKKEDGTVLIVYAPYNLGRIPDDQMNKLDGKRNTVVSNFRGRLLNDIVISMITAR